ncbi:glycosyltransferase [Cerasicoccus arenae]|uniref:Glycosyl transferase family 1 domain-containing protein n=1 Tax=Cerasicoccus arenae TaxID=424488 RepID=A0A8J3DB59_9BACT|nr:glycosyltransferase [Cerasicoccus arenae]MBK1858644.1 glycosyltransferase family 4 protein [Cerasicoccus arenae]GHC04822.1 hypothetical protein GCM10007047_22090 [Cerasicoccus arenae]
MIAIIQSTVLEYRLGLYRILREQLSNDLKVVCGEQTTDPNQRTPVEVWDFASKVRNHYFAGDRLLWQQGAYRLLKDCPLVVVDSNMRFVSTLLLLLSRRLRGLPTVAWGHASGKSRIGQFFRKYYYGRFSGIIAYTESQRLELSEQHKNLPIWSMCNACLGIEDCAPAPVTLAEYTDFIFVGRLTARKKPALLIKAFVNAVQRELIPAVARLVLVGDDQARSDLEGLAADSGIADRIIFTGSIHDKSQLRNLYKRAIAAVSPGYVGLSVTQATGFGVPVLVARDEPHSPEIEVCRDGFNSLFFPSNDISALADLIGKVYSERELWHSRRGSIAEDTANRYSFERMADTFLRVERHFNRSVIE